MQINFNQQQATELNYGSVVTFFNVDGTVKSVYMITKDSDGCDYRAVNLQTFEITGYECSSSSMLDVLLRKNGGSHYLIIPSEQVSIGRVE